jgi:hypothetical protein
LQVCLLSTSPEDEDLKGTEVAAIVLVLFVVGTNILKNLTSLETGMKLTSCWGFCRFLLGFFISEFV